MAGISWRDEAAELRSKRAAISIAIIVGVLAAVLPIMISLHLSRQQSLREQRSTAAMLADDVLRRSEKTGDQVFAATRILQAAGAGDPCSDENIALMAGIAISSEELETVGYVAGDRLMCSSFGRYGAGIPIGPAAYLGAMGALVRPSVKLPFATGVRFLIVTQKDSGYSTVVSRELPIDVFVSNPEISLGVYGYTSKQLILGRGAFRLEWVNALGNDLALNMFDGQSVVAIRRSTRYDFAAFAAIPETSVESGLRHVAVVLVPIGVLAGVLLAWAVLFVARQQLALPALLKAALKRNEFFLLYQPIVDLATGTWIGAEALIRWRHSGSEMMRPDLFIPAAEDAGLIQRITECVIGIIARESKDIFKRHPSFHMAINLSAADLQSTRTVELFRRLAQATGAGPGNLLVEAGERGFLNTELARKVIRDLRAIGISVAIDDFGTGYSSLSYLGTFELDYLKIDKSFVDSVGTEAATSQVVPHIIEMAKTLNLKMIAEGVETHHQAEFLRKSGVPYAQGWLFGKAMPLHELLSGLR
jgi:sensor c-di-GMP phosphodiesterase-like protein